MTWKIIVDSSCDLRTMPNLAEGVEFINVPLTINIGEQLFVDNEELDISAMMDTMYASSEAAGSACPSPEAYKAALEGADKAVIITITGGLSGSHNAARLGCEMYLEEHPDAQVHLIDSLSAGGEVDLLAHKVNDLIAQNLEFGELVSEMTAYQEKTKLVFVLEKVDNLVKNGRLSKVKAAVVGLLNVRLVGQASSEGILELLQKARGHKKAVSTCYAEMQKAGYQGGRVSIAHNSNEKFSQQLTDLVKADYPDADVTSVHTSGLCSFYAEAGGMMIGYEI